MSTLLLTYKDLNAKGAIIFATTKYKELRVDCFNIPLIAINYIDKIVFQDAEYVAILKDKLPCILFMIDGYYKDDKSEFSNYLVCAYDDTPKHVSDEDIFYHGLGETEIIKAIQDGTKTTLEFVITSYCPMPF